MSEARRVLTHSCLGALPLPSPNTSHLVQSQWRESTRSFLVVLARLTTGIRKCVYPSFANLRLVAAAAIRFSMRLDCRLAGWPCVH